ncbi:MAG TPA: DUF3224 domain-containing protein [Baekduia sp.]|jgi:Protein of unknown function (DUF3224)|nr:DUF3224 domain-containing protein [Baekduia sp.]
MSTHAQAKFEVQSWEENAYAELEGDAKLTRASVGQAFTGDLDGEGAVEWLMCYRQDKTAEFVGLQRFVGSLGGRSGSFVMRTEGSFDGSEAKGSLAVVAGSGTEELSAITGTGSFAAPLGSTASVELDYDVE